MQSDLEKELRGMKLSTLAEEEEDDEIGPHFPPEDMNLDNDGIDPPQYLDDDEDELLHPLPEEPDPDDLIERTVDGAKDDEGEDAEEAEDAEDIEDTDEVENMDPPTHPEHHLPDGKERLRKIRRTDGDETS